MIAPIQKHFCCVSPISQDNLQTHSSHHAHALAPFMKLDPQQFWFGVLLILHIRSLSKSHPTADFL